MSASWCLSNALTQLAKLPEAERDAYIATLPEACSRPSCTSGQGCRAYVASVAGSTAQLHRRMCEARHWLRLGYTTAPKVHQLIESIASKRGHEAADLLRQDMRAEWARRSQWMR
ncbi:hypothetical protein [Pseudoxanthomonas sp. USHLN014]|uniref:DUF7696 family protein n=1 Tax=Pseudoxanthomonas sp. USHLN014 TaxID=3081297 RepID=UPI00301DD0EE